MLESATRLTGILLPTPVAVPVPASVVPSPDLPSLSLSTRGSILFARFESCGPDVVALPRAPSRAR
jgi:hypothetical protein